MRVLLISHEASRTGAPRVAILVARSLVADGHTVHVVSRARGPLLAEFEAVAPTTLEPLNRVRRRLWSWRVTRTLAFLVDTALAAMTLLRRRADVVYVNSTSAAIYLRPARWLRRRVVLHVHESQEIASRFFESSRPPGNLEGIDIIACSPSVQDGMCALTGRSAKEVPLLPSVPDDAEVETRAREKPDRDYPSGELVVGCCGTVERRKGADLWVAAAREVRKALPEASIRFVWIGEIAQPVDLAGADDVEFIGPSSNPYAHMRHFDVATLPSRDDPFPLVVLEAMLLGRPVVAFSVGGVSRQIGDAGILVPPGDVSAFAQAIINLLGDDASRAELGAAARARVIDQFSSHAFAAGLAHVIEDPQAFGQPLGARSPRGTA